MSRCPIIYKRDVISKFRFGVAHCYKINSNLRMVYICGKMSERIVIVLNAEVEMFG